MNIRECVKVRHSVRAYEDRPIDAKVAEDLKVMIQQCNREGDMHFQLIQDEPKALLESTCKIRQILKC